MTAKAMRAEDAPIRIAKPIRRLLDWGSASVKFKRQISDGEKLLFHLWGNPIPQTEAALKDLEPLFDLKAVYTNGRDTIAIFLEFNTEFDEPTRDRLMATAISNAPRGYTGQQLGHIWRVDWKVHRLLDLRQVNAINRPPDYDRQYDRRYSDERRKKKKLEPKKETPAQRYKAGERRRRAAEIAAVIPPEGTSVAAICKRLSQRKHTPFHEVAMASLPKTVNRIVTADGADFITYMRPAPGRPDLQPSLWVFRKPQDLEQYRAYFAVRLSSFSQTDAARIPRWFQEDDELRRSLAVPEQLRAELSELARARRDELLRR